MRIVTTIVAIICVSYGLYWISTNRPEVKTRIEEFIEGGQFHTLEIKYSAKQIMESHKRELLKDDRHSYLEPTLKFYPYLLMEVKYTLSDERTREGIILWDLFDGEMVIDTKDWDKTHGFGDCINASTEKHEFKIINILSKRGGSLDRDGLSKALHVENDVLGTWIDACLKKKLIVQSGNRYRLHLQDPRLRTIPETRINEWLVTKPYKNAIRLSKRYSLTQIQKIARAAFGHDFVIRQTTDVYLPIHSIVVQNPDGSVKTTHWNALNGKRLNNGYLLP